ncbi:CANB1-like protein [Mya arenaria]|uniref:CANB1-like protein n=1 Tax=Mya arenaria TaxID=6604 RepID=A0ABY7EGN7_MYAAR|nr:CANB1-like protein [Mya arenaria]
MGNEQAVAQLPGQAQPRDVVNNMRKGTPFTYEEADQILRRYNTMDSSPQGNTGIPVEECCLLQEFTGCVFAPDLIRYYRDKETKRIHPRQFMKICTMLCPRTQATKKKHMLFDLFDVDRQKVLTHDAMFRVYKLLFAGALSDDQILALMIPDNEIQERLSVDFAFDPALRFVGGQEEEDEDDGEEDN